MPELLGEPGGRQVLLWAIAAGTVFAITVWIRAQLLSGAEILEGPSWGYTPEVVTARLRQFGPSGRSGYVLFQAVDLLLIATLTGAMLQAMRWGLVRLSPGVGLTRFVLGLPVAYAAVDALEDLALVGLVFRFSNRPDALSSWASMLTVAKWVVLGASFVATLVIVGVAVVLPGRQTGVLPRLEWALGCHQGT